MHQESTKCLLTRLQQLNAEAPHIPLSMFGNFFANPKNQYNPETPKPKLFIEITTEDEMTEIDICKTEITTILQELKSKQEEFFKEQKKMTKRCYDMFSKYEGPEQSSEWMRSLWFGLHFNERDEWVNKHYKKDEDSSRQCLPAEWKQKMRFGKPSTYGKTEEEIKNEEDAYNTKKKEWEAYVDQQWDTAYDDAFGVKEFVEFLNDIPEKINVDLYSITAQDISKKWENLEAKTLYFAGKISMNHIDRHIDGYTLSLIPDHAWKPLSKPGWQRFVNKVAALTNYVSYLSYMRVSQWDGPVSRVNDTGKECIYYSCYHPRTRTRIEINTPPTKPVMKQRK